VRTHRPRENLLPQTPPIAARQLLVDNATQSWPQWYASAVRGALGSKPNRATAKWCSVPTCRPPSAPHAGWSLDCYAIGRPKTPPGLRRSLTGSLSTACRRKHTGDAAEGRLSRG
jgi:hypothetical protein